MKKLCSFFAGILAFLLILTCFKWHMDSQITENKAGLRDYRSYPRFGSTEAQELLIDDNTLVIFGSSELVRLTDYSEKVCSFLNGDQMNVMTIGGGGFQSLYHAMALGSLAEDIPTKKIAFFLSPQWFVKEGYDAAAFASRMSENQLLDFLANPNISKANKLYALERTEALLANSPTQKARVEKYRKAIENPISANALYMGIFNLYWDYRAEYEAYQELNRVNNNLPYYDLDSIDFDAILSLAEEQGKASCTNNDFGVQDEYWDTYVKAKYAAGENPNKVQYYTQSVEYDDMRCFLSVAQELGFEVLVFSIPVNGKWYDFQGQLCDDYYQIVKDVALEYDNVSFYDMSVYEDEPYFLRDIMHLGWKGWARINEILYTEFTEKQ